MGEPGQRCADPTLRRWIGCAESWGPSVVPGREDSLLLVALPPLDVRELRMSIFLP